jgi:diaminohydroxyphosphoribosylaminopyrimidine deaminase/5-amino-6-(5-phosphoribosylamino)uracil reductase
MADPNPLVGGKGLARLRAAGILVTTPVCAEEALAVNPGFVSRMTRQLPWVWMKLASSLDGRIALGNGESKWITGEAARADGHHWRARSCVVLTGSGTVLADDPQLSVRYVATARQPFKAIVDTRFEVNEDARIFDGTRTWVFTCRYDREKATRLAQRNVEVIELPSAGGRVDLLAMMRWLAQNNINEVHVEAGARLSGALLQAHCVDELLLYMAPMLLGSDAIDMVRMDPLHSLDQAQRFSFIDMSSLAPDIRLRARDAARWQALLDAVPPG